MKQRAILNLSLGIAMGLAGIGSLALSAVWISNNMDAIRASLDPSVRISQQAEQAATCSERLTSIGLDATANGPVVFAGLEDFPEPETAIGLSSLALYVCENHSLDYFCLGSACPTPLAMRLAAR